MYIHRANPGANQLRLQNCRLILLEIGATIPVVLSAVLGENVFRLFPNYIAMSESIGIVNCLD